MKLFNYHINLNHTVFVLINYFGWRRGVVVTELVVSTKLLYAEPG